MDFWKHDKDFEFSRYFLILGYEPQACFTVLWNSEKMMTANFFSCKYFDTARLPIFFYNFSEKIQGEAESQAKTESR